MFWVRVDRELEEEEEKEEEEEEDINGDKMMNWTETEVMCIG